MFNLLSFFKNEIFRKDFLDTSKSKIILQIKLKTSTHQKLINYLYKLSDSKLENYIKKSYSKLSYRKKLIIICEISNLINLINDYQKIISISYKQSTSIKLTDWEFLSESKEISCYNGYYGQTWVNHKEKQILLTSIGTKINFHEIENLSKKNLYGGKTNLFLDIINDIILISDSYPPQIYDAIKYYDYIIKKINFDKKDYKLILTGHSLGAAIADLLCLYLTLNKKSDIINCLSLSFENSGTKNISVKFLKNILEKHFVDSLPEIYYLSAINDFSQKCFVLNNLPNWFNAGGKQLGKIFMISNISEYDGIIKNNTKPQTKIMKELEWMSSLHKIESLESIKIIHPVSNWPEDLFFNFIKNEYLSLTQEKIYSKILNFIDISKNKYKNNSIKPLIFGTKKYLDTISKNKLIRRLYLYGSYYKRKLPKRILKNKLLRYKNFMS